MKNTKTFLGVPLMRIFWLFIYSVVLCLLVGVGVWYFAVNTLSNLDHSDKSTSMEQNSNIYVDTDSAQNQNLSQKVLMPTPSTYDASKYLIYTNPSLGGVEILYPQNYETDDNCCRVVPQTSIAIPNLQYLTTIVDRGTIREGTDYPLTALGLSYYPELGDNYTDVERSVMTQVQLSYMGSTEVVGPVMIDGDYYSHGARRLDNNYFFPLPRGTLVVTFSGTAGQDDMYINDMLSHYLKTYQFVQNQ